MSTYAIGDIQGCFSALEALLAKIQFDARNDTLWCTGDLVNRGTQSLDVLRFFYALGAHHQIVLGNHDLHLLAVAYGVRPLSPADTMQDILAAPDREQLIDWLRHRPMLVQDTTLDYVMTHAGVAPMWNVAQAVSLAHEIETVLRGEHAAEFLRSMYGNSPDKWTDALLGADRLRCAVNYLTRMRYCYADGRMDFSYKGDILHKPAELFPWFEVEPRAASQANMLFGHWAALRGTVSVPNVFALDTGCVWGHCLTAMRLEDKAVFSVDCGRLRHGERTQ